ALAEAVPGLERVMRYGGAAFLLVYGARAFVAAWRGGEVLEAGQGTGGRARALLTCLALTWLNPHVYLDTVVLLGSVSAQYDNRLGFGAGAVGASFVFFLGLGFGARLLAPFFRRPLSWRVLDALVGAVMWAIAAGLLLG
ncbi:MAG: LysE/ArgO family amino acid transporter, partial [Roseovarius sp.]